MFYNKADTIHWNSPQALSIQMSLTNEDIQLSCDVTQLHWKKIGKGCWPTHSPPKVHQKKRKTEI